MTTATAVTLTLADLGDRIVEHLDSTNGAHVIVLAGNPVTAEILMRATGNALDRLGVQGKVKGGYREVRVGNRIARFYSERQQNSIEGARPSLGIVFEPHAHRRRNAQHVLEHACMHTGAEVLAVSEDRSA